MASSTASSIIPIQFPIAPSIFSLFISPPSRELLVISSLVFSEIMSRYLSQLALVKLLLFSMLLTMGFVEILIITGKWSDVVSLPGSIAILRYAFLFESTASGFPCHPIKIEKSGPKWLMMFRLIKSLIALPLLLFCW